jgi:hypothetical protein
MLEAKTGDKIPMVSADRTALIDSIKTQAAPLKERETVSMLLRGSAGRTIWR